MKVTGSQIKNLLFNKITLAVVLLVGIGGGYYAYSSPESANTAAQTTAQSKVTRGTIEVAVSGTGTIAPVNAEYIGPGVSGTVRKIHVREGEQVKKGQLLVELSSDSLDIELAKARFDLEKARINVANSASELSADTITAPIAGRIVKLEVKAGNDVSKNSVLATIQDDSQLVFDMLVDGTTANQAALNQKVEVFLPDRGETVEGKVVAKGNQALPGYNGQSRNNLKVAVPAFGDLSTGMKAFGTITINGKAIDALSVGTLEWKNEADVKATLAGKVNGIYVQEGQVVQTGQKLFALDSTTNASQVASQQLSYQQALLTLSNLEKEKADLLVKAPADGIITGMDIEVGEEVAGGNGSTTNNSNSTNTATLGKIFNIEQMEVTFPVDEVEIAKVKVGQVAKVKVDALEDEEFEGKVVEIAQEGTVTNNVSSFDVTILLDNDKKLLKSGMTANVTIEVIKKDNALLIPIEALQEMGDRKMVMVPGTDRPQQRVPVSVGLTNDTFAEITDGLQEGDVVLIPGQQTQTGVRAGVGMPGMGGGMPRTSGMGGGMGGVRIRN